MRRLVIKRFILIFGLFSALQGFGRSVEDCQQCHADKDLTKSINDSAEISLYVDQARYDKSVHSGFGCVDCHTTVKSVEHESELPPVNCAGCHEDIQSDYVQSIHATSNGGINVIPAHCRDCHGTHAITSSSDSTSWTYPSQIEHTCGNCHSKAEVIQLIGIRGSGPVAGYHESVHARILKQDPSRGAPTCINCHGSHRIFLMSDPRSSFNKLNRAETCGTCHQQIKEEYFKSIHWHAVQRGHYESPTCNDCHGEHEIQSPDDKKSITNRLNLSSQVCARCHSSETMMSRFGLDAEQFTSYMRSYHGLAILKGSPDAANCTSCHEIHAIQDRTTAESGVHPSNLEKTCGKCHQNITADFINIAVHPKDMKSRNPIAYYARTIYVWMIIVLIGGMVIHNVIILINFIRKRRKEKAAGRTYQRFQPFEVYQHQLLILSFFILVITGFALKFPDAGWVRLLVSIGMSEPVRSLLHRIAAVILIIISLVQLGYFLFHRKGRKEIMLLRPQVSDLTGFWQNMKFYLGLSQQRPKFGRWDYTEKAEYLALIWGTAVMAMSGFILWFPEFFIGFLPTWLFETSEVIHYFEAWLATLAIFFWHWFFVIYHPERYPMSLTWMDGRISEEEMKHHHPLEYEELNKKDQYVT